MTDCKGAFGFGYELDIGGAQAAFAQYASGKVKNKNKPSAGMTGIKVRQPQRSRSSATAAATTRGPTALKETRRLMEQLNADVMLGPLSGDEAVYGRELREDAPDEDVHHRDGGLAGSDAADRAEEHVPLPRRRRPVECRHRRDRLQEAEAGGKAAIIMDDYSFGWTSAAGIIADFCAIGGQITKRVFPPLNTTDYAPFVRQLPAPNQVDGYFWVVGGTGHRRPA